MGERTRRRLRRGAAVLLLAGAAYYFVWGGEYTLPDLRELASERDSLAARVESLRAVVDSLERRAAVLETSDFAIERAARERYGFIRDGEQLYRFLEVVDDSSGGAGTRP